MPSGDLPGHAVQQRRLPACSEGPVEGDRPWRETGHVLPRLCTWADEGAKRHQVQGPGRCDQGEM